MIGEWCCFLLLSEPEESTHGRRRRADPETSPRMQLIPPSAARGRRQHEIGIRMAIGARSHDIMRAFVSGGLRHILIGIAIGVAAPLAGTRLLAGVLFQVKQTDPATYATVSVILLTVTLAAMLAPARRATKVDPVVALRHQ